MCGILETNSIEEQAKLNFQNGYHCAESVVAAVLEGMGEDAASAIAHSTAFGGGFGRTFDEACGALSGCLIAIGHFNARQSQGESWDEAAELGAMIRQKFIELYGSTHCGVLRNEFGENQPEKCAAVTGKLAAALVELLQVDGD